MSETTDLFDAPPHPMIREAIVASVKSCRLVRDAVNSAGSEQELLLSQAYKAKRRSKLALKLMLRAFAK